MKRIDATWTAKDLKYGKHKIKPEFVINVMKC